MVKSAPASERDMGSIPDSGRFHTPQGSQGWAAQLLSPCFRACAVQQEKPPKREARVLKLESRPACHSWRKPERSSEDPAQSKINK